MWCLVDIRVGIAFDVASVIAIRVDVASVVPGIVIGVVAGVVVGIPAAVVSDVKMIGLKRSVPDRTTASYAFMPFSRALLIKSIRIRLSLTTTPASAIRPKRENMLIASPISMCPSTAPISPNGMTDMMTNGCV